MESLGAAGGASAESLHHLSPSAGRTLLQLLIHGSQARADLARRLGLSRAQLTRATAELIRQGLVIEGRSVHQAVRGRPLELLEVQTDAGHFVGIKLTGTTMYFVLVDLAATIVYETESPLVERSVGHVIERFVSALTQLQTETGIRPIGVGIAAAGDPVERDGEIWLEGSDFLGWDAVPLASKITAAVGLPTTVVNDVNALAGAHHWFGAGAPSSLVVFGVGAGIGAGVVLGGELLTGAHGRGGRVGHDYVAEGGMRCNNGHDDCVHSFVTIPAIEHNAGVVPGEYPAVVQRARKGEPMAIRAFKLAAAALGTAVASVVNTLDPDQVTVMGEGTEMLEFEEREFRQRLEAKLERVRVDDVHIARPAFHFDLYARGAAVAAMREMLS